MERMLRIWKERKVYSNAFIKELEELIEPEKAKERAEAPHQATFKVRSLYACVHLWTLTFDPTAVLVGRRPLRATEV